MTAPRDRAPFRLIDLFLPGSYYWHSRQWRDSDKVSPPLSSAYWYWCQRSYPH